MVIRTIISYDSRLCSVFVVVFVVDRCFCFRPRRRQIVEKSFSYNEGELYGPTAITSQIVRTIDFVRPISLTQSRLS